MLSIFTEDFLFKKRNYIYWFILCVYETERLRKEHSRSRIMSLRKHVVVFVVLLLSLLLLVFSGGSCSGFDGFDACCCCCCCWWWWW